MKNNAKTAHDWRINRTKDGNIIPIDVLLSDYADHIISERAKEVSDEKIHHKIREIINEDASSIDVGWSIAEWARSKFVDNES